MIDDIETFHSPKRAHMNNGMLSPVDFELWQQKLNEAGRSDTGGTSVRPVNGAQATDRKGKRHDDRLQGRAS